MRPYGSILAVLAIFASAGVSFAVEGDWLTDADRALAAARKAKQPVLAVAMDHG